MTKVNIKLDSVRRMLDEPRVIGLKDRSGNLIHFERVCAMAAQPTRIGVCGWGQNICLRAGSQPVGTVGSMAEPMSHPHHSWNNIRRCTPVTCTGYWNSNGASTYWSKPIASVDIRLQSSKVSSARCQCLASATPLWPNHSLFSSTRSRTGANCSRCRRSLDLAEAVHRPSARCSVQRVPLAPKRIASHALSGTIRSST